MKTKPMIMKQHIKQELEMHDKKKNMKMMWTNQHSTTFSKHKHELHANSHVTW